jgi:hypothetical protein
MCGMSAIMVVTVDGESERQEVCTVDLEEGSHDITMALKIF